MQRDRNSSKTMVLQWAEHRDYVLGKNKKRPREISSLQLARCLGQKKAKKVRPGTFVVAGIAVAATIAVFLGVG